MSEAMYFADEDQMEAFLAHHGVKGMRWGVSRAGTSGGGSASVKKKVASGRTQAQANAEMIARRNAALTTAKQASFAVARAGIPPLLIASGAAIPVAVTAGVTMKLLQDPTIKQAISDTGAYLKKTLDENGPVAMSNLKKNLFKIDDGTTATSVASGGDSARKIAQTVRNSVSQVNGAGAFNAASKIK